MASPRALLGSPKCVADVDEIADLECKLPHTKAHRGEVMLSPRVVRSAGRQAPERGKPQST
jgi:hypothetical protein